MGVAAMSTAMHDEIRWLACTRDDMMITPGSIGSTGRKVWRR
jgi:hypothetical protein